MIYLKVLKTYVTLLAPYRSLPIFWFHGGLWMIANYLVKIIVPPVTAYMELKETPPLFF